MAKSDESELHEVDVTTDDGIETTLLLNDEDAEAEKSKSKSADEPQTKARKSTQDK